MSAVLSYLASRLLHTSSNALNNSLIKKINEQDQYQNCVPTFLYIQYLLCLPFLLVSIIESKHMRITNEYHVTFPT